MLPAPGEAHAVQRGRPGLDIRGASHTPGVAARGRTSSGSGAGTSVVGVKGSGGGAPKGGDCSAADAAVFVVVLASPDGRRREGGAVEVEAVVAVVVYWWRREGVSVVGSGHDAEQAVFDDRMLPFFYLG